uniref:EGF-like domain-containing protein n=1 Tax=Zonotrichia albicollis TaxID=44394 RepID=A0A8D2MIQ8_ZONAL
CPPDIDECRISPDLCGHGSCVNTPGSFECECFEGYESGFMMMKNCMDINECERDPLLCRGGICMNTDGSFECICPPGHELTAEGNTCIGEGSAGKPHRQSSCRALGGKVSLPVSLGAHSKAKNLCPLLPPKLLPGPLSVQGWVPVGPCQLRVLWLSPDIDECTITNGGCDTHCSNSEGSYECSCSEGYALMPDKRSCAGQCPPWLLQVLPQGPLCPHSWLQDQGVSSSQRWMILLCTATPSCSQFGISSFPLVLQLSLCSPWHGLLSADIDECEDNPEICDGGQCTNIPGEYRCLCFDEPHWGVLGVSHGCFCPADVNECDLNPNICLHGECENTKGSFICHCQLGYFPPALAGWCPEHIWSVPQGSGTSSQMSGEAQGHGRSCSLPAVGGHPPGLPWAGRGQPPAPCPLPADVDECADNVNLCENGQCLNAPGGYRCECEMGFNPTEDNINECADPVNCINGLCVNTPGSYLCNCPQDFELNPTGVGCVDINECEEEPNICLFGTCTNTPGSFQCVCPPGFVLSDNGRRCFGQFLATLPWESSGMDGCFLHGGTPGGGASQLPKDTKRTLRGSVRSLHGQWGAGQVCAWPQQGSECVLLPADENECRSKPGICPNGRCVNTAGSYRCDCNEGFEVSASGTECIGNALLGCCSAPRQHRQIFGGSEGLREQEGTGDKDTGHGSLLVGGTLGRNCSLEGGEGLAQLWLPLELFKARLDGVWDTLGQWEVSLPMARVALGGFKVPPTQTSLGFFAPEQENCWSIPFIQTPPPSLALPAPFPLVLALPQSLDLCPPFCAQTPGRASASRRCCRPCARCPPPTATWSPSPSAAATAGAAGAPSASSAPCLALPTTRRCVPTALATPRMAEVSGALRCLLGPRDGGGNDEADSMFLEGYDII